MGSILSRSSAAPKGSDSVASSHQLDSLPTQEPPRETTALPDDIEQEIKKLPEDKRSKVRDKIWRFKDAIQPHTDEGGDANFFGDLYQEIDKGIVHEWEKGVE